MTITNRLTLGLALLLLFTVPASAQEEAPVDFPTLAALETVDIPPRDRVQLAQALLGVGEIPPPPAGCCARSHFVRLRPRASAR